MDFISQIQVKLDTVRNALMLATMCGAMGAYFDHLSRVPRPPKWINYFAARSSKWLFLPLTLSIVSAICAVYSYIGAKVLFTISLAFLLAIIVYPLLPPLLDWFFGRPPHHQRKRRKPSNPANSVVN